MEEALGEIGIILVQDDLQGDLTTHRILERSINNPKASLPKALKDGILFGDDLPQDGIVKLSLVQTIGDQRSTILLRAMSTWRSPLPSLLTRSTVEEILAHRAP